MRFPLNMPSFSRLYLIFLIYIIVPYTVSQNKPGLVKVNRYDFYLTLSDGVILDCSKFIPDIKAPTNGFPCVIYCHGFGRNKEDGVYAALDQAQYGFYTLCFSMRGQGNSGGYSNLISTTEMNDLLEVIRYVKSETITNGDRIGVAGSSQGAIIALMAACSGAGIRCVVSDLGSPEFASSWIENGCIKITFVWSLSYDNSIVRYNEQVKQYREWALSDDKSGWENLAASLPVNRDFQDKIKDLHVPVIISNSWQDKFFNALGFIKAISFLNVPYRMYFGSVTGHGGDVSEQEKIFHERFWGEWIAYWLADRQNLVLNANKFVYSATSFLQDNSTTFTRFESPVWPPADVQNIKFYFTSGSRLSRDAINRVSTETNTVTFINDVTDQNLRMIQAVNYEFRGEEFESRFHKTEITFDSEPLERNYTMAGTPQVNLNYSSDVDICQFNFQIWEVKPGEQQGFVTSINFTDRNYTPNELRETLINGESTGHIFKKGSMIRIVLTNLDTRPDERFLRTFPFVLPVLKRANNLIYTDLSYIILPLM